MLLTGPERQRRKLDLHVEAYWFAASSIVLCGDERRWNLIQEAGRTFRRCAAQY